MCRQRSTTEKLRKMRDRRTGAAFRLCSKGMREVRGDTVQERTEHISLIFPLRKGLFWTDPLQCTPPSNWGQPLPKRQVQEQSLQSRALFLNARFASQEISRSCEPKAQHHSLHSKPGRDERHSKLFSWERGKLTKMRDTPQTR